MKTKYLYYLLSPILGVIYWFMIDIGITNNQIKPLNNIYYFTIKSHISQSIQLNIYSYPKKITEVICNGSKMEYIDFAGDYTYKNEEKMRLKLKDGENNCSIAFVDKLPRNPKIKRKIDSIEYSILFLLIGLPLFSIIFHLFIATINRLFRRDHADLS